MAAPPKKTIPAKKKLLVNMKATLPLTAKQFIEQLKKYSSPEEAKKTLKYFKTEKGAYGEGDVFIGVRMGQVFKLAKEFMDMPLGEVEKLLESPIHEVRTGSREHYGFPGAK